MWKRGQIKNRSEKKKKNRSGHGPESSQVSSCLYFLSVKPEMPFSPETGKPAFTGP